MSDFLKQCAAENAFNHVMHRLSPTDILGVGTGSTVNRFIELLEGFTDKFAGAVSSSNQSTQLLEKIGVNVVDLNDVTSTIPFYVDGADESDSAGNLIKGGGAALTREKIVADACDTFVCIIDHTKYVNVLGTFPLPVEVIPMAINNVSRRLSQLGGVPKIRHGVVTDNGNTIIDVHGLQITDPLSLEQSINQIPGVVTNGIFAANRADVLICAYSNDRVDCTTFPRATVDY